MTTYCGNCRESARRSVKAFSYALACVVLSALVMLMAGHPIVALFVGVVALGMGRNLLLLWQVTSWVRNQ